MDKKEVPGKSLIPAGKRELINSSPLVTRGLDLAKSITAVSKYKASLIWVDDEEDILAFAKSFWRKRGCNVATFKNGLDALEELKKNNYDLLVTDIRNSEISGIDLLRRVIELKLPLKTMVYSGVGDAAIRNEAKKLGVVAYMTKPINIDELEVVIEKALKK